jgi:uncharacterized protein Yka (UPF0111/DUF47 family)
VSWLFPDERRFFEHFSRLAARLTAEATLLEQALDQPARLPELLSEINRVQQEADHDAHDLDLNVDKLFIPPMDREDIHALTVRLGLVADFIGGAARRAVSLKATTRREPAVALARIVARAVREIDGAVSHLRTGEDVLIRCEAIKQAEEEGDVVWQAAVTDLFEGAPDPVDVIRWKTLYDQLEETLDACDDVANELETITVKHT